MVGMSELGSVQGTGYSYNKSLYFFPTAACKLVSLLGNAIAIQLYEINSVNEYYGIDFE